MLVRCMSRSRCLISRLFAMPVSMLCRRVSAPPVGCCAFVFTVKKTRTHNAKNLTLITIVLFVVGLCNGTLYAPIQQMNNVRAISRVFIGVRNLNDRYAIFLIYFFK